MSELIDSDGTKDVRLGMKVDFVEEKLGVGKKFRRAPGSSLTTEHFINEGLLIGFDTEGVIHLIEFGALANLTVSGERIIGKPMRSVAKLFHKIFNSPPTWDGDVFEFQEEGIVLWSPDGVDGLVESLILERTTEETSH